MSRQNTKLESEGAEFLVLGQLLARGIPAYKTYSNMPGYDVVAFSTSIDRAAKIEVKCRSAKKTRSYGVKKIDADFFVFVHFNREAEDGDLEIIDPEYFILPAKVVKEYSGDREDWRNVYLKKENENKHRSQWSLILDFLKMSKSKN